MKKEKQESDKDLGFWAEGTYMKPMSKEDMDSKMDTFHKKHDEDMNFNCRKCNKKISAHNKDWHESLCDECFDKEYFHE